MSIVATIIEEPIAAKLIFGVIFYFLVKHKTPLFHPRPPRPSIPTPVTDAMFPWVLGNFALFFLLSSLIGGDAVNGYTDGGQ